MDRTVPLLLKRIAGAHPDVVAQFSRSDTGSFSETTYRECFARVLDISAGLVSLGLRRGDHIGLIADNRREWLQASHAIMALGGADVPRGCDATEQEIAWILSHAACTTSFLENAAQLGKVLSSRSQLPALERVVLFDAPGDDTRAAAEAAGLALFLFDELAALGVKWRGEHPAEIEAILEQGQSDDLATLIFTSGTTGEPKGVMLSHRNFLSQLPDLATRIVMNPGERALCVLPVWHSFERLCEYVILNAASGIIYSKPIGSILLADFASMNPQLLPSVPRIWESVYDGIYRAMRKTGGASWILFNFFVEVAKLHARFARIFFSRGPIFNRFNHVIMVFLSFLPTMLLYPLRLLGNVLVFRKIRAKLGNAFRGGVSGGGGLPPNIDAFFWAVGVKVVEGYGLTETAPVVAVRPFGRPVYGTIGKPLDCCELRIVDEKGNELPPGKKGSVMVRGENVMRGYYKREDLTAKVLSPDGWFDTGDLGLKTVNGEIILRGRKKDTIVLRGGENVEPTPIEMKINESRYIAQSVVVGQDQRHLGALVVPNADEIEAWAKENDISCKSYRELLADERVRRFIEQEVDLLVSPRTGFKLFERVNRIALLEKPFEQGLELSAKQEIMRHKLDHLYKREMRSLFE